MRGLVVFCFVALCSAAPNGYDYPRKNSAPAAGGYGVQPVISKRFYIFSGPIEEGVEVQHHDITVGTPRRNYNVVFVKAPVEKQQKIKLRVTPAANEEKTAIYVLSKKADAPVVETFVQEPVTTTSKPEVAFIKYRTNEEAEHAQRQIQAEYDLLGGSTSISDEGVSSVKSVIGILDSLQAGAVGNSAVSAASGYLPPTKK
ncbi:uncharacterized protein LOC133334862 [Musca vetustissima]|uniref:uncharacterized protein LOC133334862 n=1 Tax=Musca vetustissima TaxID=27455 RepID=UPI002AB6ADCE|nr:uncharacterized protein LOC133334862 [Musca vetustissima]